MRRFLVFVAVLAVLALAAWMFWPRDPVQATLATVERGVVEQVVSNTRAGYGPAAFSDRSPRLARSSQG